ncbi:hypothetical protein JVU11DRAFT_6154 [Chiua virens]|nr:hypothetical protein JVU11DRAFT_6154 [Chiua virens]
MDTNGIPLDKAELLATLLEGILYGFSVLMFGGTLRVLMFQRATYGVNRKMLTVSCLLLLFSSVHLVIDIIRIMQGLILYRDTYPGGPIEYFSNVAQWTFISKNYIYIVQTIIGDGVLLYRCYAVWQSKFVMVLPGLLWCASGVTGFAATYTASQASGTNIFNGSLGKWITSFWASAFATNVLATSLLAYRIWHLDHRSAGLRGHRRSQLRPILHIILDSALIYSLTLLTGLICFVSGSNAQYVVLDMVMPIISITFYMVIIRVGLANKAYRLSNVFPLGYTSPDNSSSFDRRNRMQVHITSLTESQVENHSMSPNAAVNYDRRNETKTDGRVGEEEV